MNNKFKDKLTEDIYNGLVKKGLSISLVKITRIKLIRICATKNLSVLKIPPSNNLEKLKGDRNGQYSIRVNDKYRICFEWDDYMFAYNIEFVDYHK